MLPGVIAASRPRSARVLENSWNPAHKSPRAVLFTADRQLGNGTAAGSYANVRTLLPLRGLCYVSSTLPNVLGGDVLGFGIIDETESLIVSDHYVGGGMGSVALWAPNGTVYYGGSVLGNAGGTGDAQIAVRVATRRVWVRRNGGGWVGGGNPAADTSPTAILPGSGRLYAAASMDAAVPTATRMTLGHIAAATSGAVPTGFTAAAWG